MNRWLDDTEEMAIDFLSTVWMRWAVYQDTALIDWMPVEDQIQVWKLISLMLEQDDVDPSLCPSISCPSTEGGS